MSKLIKIIILFISSINSVFLHNLTPYVPKINNLCADSSPFLLNILKNDINKEYIKQLSGLLPQADIISKKVLEWNDIWIENILYSRMIPEEYKKSIILEMINIVQEGDNTGTAFLEWYKNVVDCLLP